MTQYGADAGAAPRCPRHPNAVTYVRCQRCNRPVCHECQRPAPVGVQCTECVAAQQKNARPVRTIAGGRARGGAPIVTYSIIAICVVVYVLQMLGGNEIYQRLAFSPMFAASEPWRFVTSAFLHASIPHILFNMYALYLVGSQLEKVFGIWRYLSLYFLSAIGGGVAILLLAGIGIGQWNGGTVGASGAVFGLFAVLGLTMRRIKASDSQVLVLILINLALGFIIPNISWQGHVGGLLTGAVLGAVYLFAPREKRTLYSVVGTIGVAAILLGLIAVGA